MFLTNNFKSNAKTLGDDTDEIINMLGSDILLSEKGKKDEDIVDVDAVGIDNFTNIKYISNVNYFLVNPKHADQNPDYNSKGTCTTVAMQLLMGYHNYYSTDD